MRKKPARGTLRIGAANVYVRNKRTARAVAIARAANFHSWGWSEGGHLPPLLRNRPRYTALIAQGMKAPNPLDLNDCVMQVSSRLNVVHFSMTKACDEVRGSKVGCQRTFSMLAYEAPEIAKGLTVCHIAIHPNWIVGLTGGRVVDRYVDSMGVLDSMIRFAKAQGWAVIVSGDLNTREGLHKPFRTVFDVFRKHGLRVRTEGIDGVAWDASVLHLSGWHTVPERATGSDHPWIVAEFRSAKRRRSVFRALSLDVVNETVIDVVTDLGMTPEVAA